MFVHSPMIFLCLLVLGCTIGSNGLTSTNKLAQLDQIKRHFQQIDKDGDGRISESEVKGLLSTLGQKYTEGDVQIVMELADTDKDGYIDHAEFKKYMLDYILTGDDENVDRDAFRVFDTNDDGYITASELEEALKKLGMYDSQEDVAKMIQKYDIDGDGRVNFTEFTKMLQDNK